MPVNIPIEFVVILLAVNIVRQIDVKKNIAYSTSIHLVLISLLSIIGIFSVVVVYIVLHRIVKGQLFQSSRYEIHGVRSQDIRKFNMNASSILILFAIFILSALVGMVIMGAKEVVVLGLLNLVILVVVIISMLYTLMYGSKLSIIEKVREGEGYYVLVLMMMSMIVIDVNFTGWLSLLIFRMLLNIVYINSIITVL